MSRDQQACASVVALLPCTLRLLVVFQNDQGPSALPVHYVVPKELGQAVGSFIAKVLWCCIGQVMS